MRELAHHTQAGGAQCGQHYSELLHLIFSASRFRLPGLRQPQARAN